ncbi:hypothetical protein BJ322DRAFT_1110523 [Thelephora terrestris]|uniref:Uncharacterized protein n=1 Tax=Thelephora terrestris TaxID=56493 RepID=A0A9P6HBF6_9AGAM|nr:hypothetical protein BJ322DRAFT_1110523 [Thelephora terrestris]
MPSSTSSTTGKAKGMASLNEQAAQRRRGPKGYFKDSRKEYLQSHLPAYVACKKGSRQGFWHRLYSGWWERFPWKLKDNDEPPANDPAEMKRLASVTPGEEARKKEVEKHLQTCLQRLHQIRNPRPRRRKAVNQFISDYATEIDDAVATVLANRPKLDSCQRMNICYEVAQSLLKSKGADFIEELERKAAAQHEAAKEEWNLILEDISAAEDVSQARDTLFDAVHPLLQATGSYAGCHVSLIAGSPGKDGEDGFFTAVHWWPGDRTSSPDWTQWDRDAFNTGVAGPFLKYVAHTDQLTQMAINPSPTLSNSIPRNNTNDMPSTDNHPSTGVGSTPTTVTRQLDRRPLPAKKAVPASVQGANKRKHAAKSYPVRYSEDSASEEDNSGNLSGDGSGDGSSSGDSVSEDASARPKRQRTSTITTRSFN